jgi:hypothetical protein
MRSIVKAIQPYARPTSSQRRRCPNNVPDGDLKTLVEWILALK